MNGRITPSSYAARLEAFRKSDEDRNALVEELIKAFEDLKQKHEDLSDDYANEVASRRRHQASVKELEMSLMQQKQAMVGGVVRTCGPGGDADGTRGL